MRSEKKMTYVKDEQLSVTGSALGLLPLCFPISFCLCGYSHWGTYGRKIFLLETETAKKKNLTEIIKLYHGVEKFEKF